MKITREAYGENLFSRIGRAGRLMAESLAYAPHVLINRDATARDARANLVIHDPIGEVLGAVVGA